MCLCVCAFVFVCVYVPVFVSVCQCRLDRRKDTKIERKKSINSLLLPEPREKVNQSVAFSVASRILFFSYNLS